VQPFGAVEQEVKGELELELLVTATADTDRSPSVAAVAMARMFGYFSANSCAIASSACGLRVCGVSGSGSLNSSGLNPQMRLPRACMT